MFWDTVNPLSANSTKWSNTLKQLTGYDLNIFTAHKKNNPQVITMSEIFKFY